MHRNIRGTYIQVTQASQTLCNKTNNTVTILKIDNFYLMYFHTNFAGERSKKVSLLQSKNRSSITVKNKNSRREREREKGPRMEENGLQK
jgi:hypothetical protein